MLGRITITLKTKRFFFSITLTFENVGSKAM